MTIKRIDPMSCAKISGLLYAILGFIAGCFFALISLSGFGKGAPGVGGGGFGMMFGVGAIIILPIVYGLLGFLGSLIGAAIYNGLAKAVGGIVIQTE